jgi:hypothetical protein
VAWAPAGWTPGLVLEVDLRLQWVLFSLGGEVNLAQHEALAQNETVKPVTGTYTLLPAATWIASGAAPRLGPGRLILQGVLGLSLLWVTIGPTNPPTYQQQQPSGVDFYYGLRLGYVVDLTAKLSLALRYEERVVVEPTSFSVEGYPGFVSVPMFSGDFALLLGYTLF